VDVSPWEPQISIPISFLSLSYTLNTIVRSFPSCYAPFSPLRGWSQSTTPRKAVIINRGFRGPLVVFKLFLRGPRVEWFCSFIFYALLLQVLRLLLWSRHFANRSPLSAAARNTFPRQLQTNFESFPDNCCISRDCRLTGYFIINTWKCYLLLELPYTCAFQASDHESVKQR
jgi:hypothetical protein